MAIYLEYKDIDGDVSADGYAKHIAVTSVHFGVGRGISMEAGNMANRESTRPTLSQITITKPCDSSVTSLFKESCVGTEAKDVKIKFVRTGGDNIQEFMIYTLKEVLISGYTMTCDSEGEPQETILLSYSEIEINYNSFDGGNVSSSPQRYTYSLTGGASV